RSAAHPGPASREPGRSGSPARPPRSATHRHRDFVGDAWEIIGRRQAYRLLSRVKNPDQAEIIFPAHHGCFMLKPAATGRLRYPDAVMTEPARRKATYEDVLTAP